MGFRFELVEEKSGVAVQLADGFCLGRNHIPRGFTASPDFSRTHFAIHLKGNSASIEDLHSTNGTLLNGKKLAARSLTVLRNNDQIRAGGLLFYFRALDSSTSPRSSPPPPVAAFSIPTPTPAQTANPTANPIATGAALPTRKSRSRTPTGPIAFCAGTIVLYLGIRFFSVFRYSLPSSPNSAISIFIRYLAAVLPGAAVGLAVFALAIGKFRKGLARNLATTIGSGAAVLLIALSALNLGDSTNYYDLSTQNELYFHCVSETNREIKACKKTYIEAVHSNLKLHVPDQEKALEAFLFPQSNAAGDPVSPDTDARDLLETAWYLGKLQDGVNRWVQMKTAISKPGFCRLDWDCFLKIANRNAIRSATELELATAVHLSFLVYQKKECGTDVGCKEKHTVRMMTALAELIGSLKTSELYAYDPIMKADYFRLHTDSEIIRLIQKLIPQFEDFAAKHPEAEGLAAAKAAFEPLPTLPNQLGLRFTQMSMDRIDAVLLSQSELKATPKEFESIHQAFAEYSTKKN